jgi:hypothetical protein
MGRFPTRATPTRSPCTWNSWPKRDGRQSGRRYLASTTTNMEQEEKVTAHGSFAYICGSHHDDQDVGLAVGRTATGRNVRKTHGRTAQESAQIRHSPDAHDRAYGAPSTGSALVVPTGNVHDATPLLSPSQGEGPNGVVFGNYQLVPAGTAHTRAWFNLGRYDGTRYVSFH